MQWTVADKCFCFYSTCRRMFTSFRIAGKSLQWFDSYLTDRTLSVFLSGGMTSPRKLTTGVPQDSVLGPLLFTLYTANIRKSYHHSWSVSPQLHWWQSTILIMCSIRQRYLNKKIISCIGDVAQWMASNRLKLNPSKSEFLWCTMARRLYLVEHSSLYLSDGNVTTASSVRNLGAYFNESMKMSTHINMLVNASFYQLRRVQAIPCSIPISVAIQLINCFVISRIDYCNSLLVALPACQMERIQSFLNYAVRIIYGRRHYDHVTPYLRDKLHWLHDPQRVMFKCCLLIYKALHGQALTYIRQFCTNVTEVQRHSIFRSATNNTSVGDAQPSHLAKIKNKVREALLFGCWSIGMELAGKRY